MKPKQWSTGEEQMSLVYPHKPAETAQWNRDYLQM